MLTKNAKLICKNVWKIYPDSASEKFSELGPAPSDEAIRQFKETHSAIFAVQDASISIQAGEVFVIMGLSGSGKSTLVRCLSRLIDASAGEIRLDGKDLLNLTNKDLVDVRRHKFGMVFQHFALLPFRTVLGNVAFPLEVQGTDKAEREARAREMIELVGLGGREEYYPRELSGGQQQRVGIARSLAVEPELWFLDEPFSALDPLIRREMQDEFLRLQNILNKTIVFITHDFDEAIRLADRIAIMKDGKIIQISTPSDLVLNPKDEYVAEFTKHVAKAKVLKIRDVMGVAPADAERSAGSVDGDLSIDDAASTLRAAGGPLLVHGKDGAIIGLVHWDDIIDILVAGRDGE
jgi:glycine betaine/proline transport system ATP-binding protein